MAKLLYYRCLVIAAILTWSFLVSAKVDLCKEKCQKMFDLCIRKKFKTLSDFNDCVTKKQKCFDDCDKTKKLKKYARSFATDSARSYNHHYLKLLAFFLHYNKHMSTLLQSCY